MEILYSQTQQGGGFAGFLPFILIMFIIYFLMIRPQTKRQKQKEDMRESLQKGDRIITMGGIYTFLLFTTTTQATQRLI